MKAFFNIDSTPGNHVYLDSLAVDIGAGVEVTATFKVWPKPYAMRIVPDEVQGDSGGRREPCERLPDREVHSGVSAAGLDEKKPMPTGTKAIKDGGWLASDEGMGKDLRARGQQAAGLLRL